MGEESIPMMLVINKYDLVEELMNNDYEMEEFMTSDYLTKFAKEQGFIGHMCTSAKTGLGITEAVSELTR